MIFGSQKETPLVGSVVVEKMPQSEQQGRGKKFWFLVGGGALVVAVLLSMVLFVVLGKNDVGKNNAAGEAFNKYAHYVLYGERAVTTSLTEQYDPTRNYVIEKKLGNRETADKVFFEEASSLLQDFVNKYDKQQGKKNKIVEKVANYWETFDFVRQYKKTAALNEEKLFARFLSEGAEATEKHVIETFQEMGKSSNALAQKYAQGTVNYYKLLLNLYDLEKQHGCIVQGEELQNCNNQQVLKQLEVLDMVAGDGLMEADNILIKAQTDILEGCWEIAGLFGEEAL